MQRRVVYVDVENARAYTERRLWEITGYDPDGGFYLGPTPGVQSRGMRVSSSLYDVKPLGPAEFDLVVAAGRR